MKRQPFTLPVQTVADTDENRIKAVLEFAWAFYRKNPYVQYDIFNFPKVGRRKYGARTCARMQNTPEMAGPQQNIYQHCCFYNYICIYHAFDHEMMGAWEDCYATPLVTSHPLVAPFEVFRYDCTGDEALDIPKMKEMFSLLRPGDLVSYTRKRINTPHVIIWLGDMNGDGQPEMINVGGKPYNLEKEIDPREEHGAVFFNASSARPYQSGEDFFSNPAGYDHFPLLKSISVLRYTDAKHAEKWPLTERAKTRLLYPGLDIWYEVEGGVYGSVVQGEELTYTLTLKNNSETDHKGIEVQLPTAEHGEIVKVNGEKAANEAIRFTADIPAGETVKYTYTVKATGNVGDVVASGVGYVHAIPLFEHYTAIVSAKEDTAAVEKAIAAADAANGEIFLQSYLRAMGMEGLLDEPGKIWTKLYTPIVLEEEQMYVPRAEADRTLRRMTIPYYFGGRNVATECTCLRVKELKAEHLQAGDIFIWQEDLDTEPMVAIHNGKDLIRADGGSRRIMEQTELDTVYMRGFFIGLRPKQVL